MAFSVLSDCRVLQTSPSVKMCPKHKPMVPQAAVPAIVGLRSLPSLYLEKYFLKRKGTGAFPYGPLLRTPRLGVETAVTVPLRPTLVLDNEKENDESWHPMSEKIYNSLDESTNKLRFSIPLPLLAYPLYLWLFFQWSRSPRKKGSHFHLDSNLIVSSEKKNVITSIVCWSAMAALLAGLTVFMGPTWIIKFHVIPYWIFVMWSDLVTYLHHHGYDEKVPWYRGKEWSYLRGGLNTIDRD